MKRTKRVKGGIVKHYCVSCGKLLYDEIPKEPTVKFMGCYIPEVKLKRYCEFRVVSAKKSKGIECGDYCVECVKNLGI